MSKSEQLGMISVESVLKCTEVSEGDRKVDGWISDLVGALTDPILCWPSTLDRPPEKFQQAITLQRLVENMVAMHENREPLGTDAECAWYISSTTLDHMIASEWVRIYMYVFGKACATMKTEVPEDLRQEKLDNYEMGLLLNLKQWIYRRRCEHRKQSERSERREQKEIVAEQQQIRKEKELDLQPKMFEL